MKWPRLKLFRARSAPSLPEAKAEARGVSDEQFDFWQENGFLVLPGFYTDPELDAVDDVLRRAWDERWSRIVVDDMDTSERLYLRDVGPERRASSRFKTNDLYLEDQSVRALALNPRIVPILKTLLGHVPVLCNSLNFRYGSQQGDHIDALFMTPRSKHHLIAIWVALEDCHADAGPLRYYPASNKIEPYVFSTGSNHVVPEEMPHWVGYTMNEVAMRSLQPQTFAARKGDVFIWSAYLLHGGSAINDPQRTRTSVVFHYYSEEDCVAQGSTLVPEAGAYWMHRPHQSVPGGGESEAPPLPANAQAPGAGVA